MTFERPEQIDGALQRLGKRLTYDYADPIALVICGGSALNVLNIAYRTTRDVDVLAVVDETEDGVKLRHDRVLPEFFRMNVASVGRDLGLDEDWLNMGPNLIYSLGEFAVAARRVSFGYSNYAERRRTQQMRQNRRAFGENRRISSSLSPSFPCQNSFYIAILSNSLSILTLQHIRRFS